MSPATDPGRAAEEMQEVRYLRAVIDVLRQELVTERKLVKGFEADLIAARKERDEARGYANRNGNAARYREWIHAEKDKRLARAEGEAAQLRARLHEAEKTGEAWKRVAVIAAIPLEAMRMGGSYKALAPSTQTCVDEAVVTIRMAVAGHSLPPAGNLDAALAPARAALTPAPEASQEAGDA
ncbi:hypothetical protein [Methylobacterium sp. 1973]|uniref:hypothetical protein n=1 Tax=Methylobacterium sp. 1973 TaxID=3156421 RepID=UPI0033939E00